MSLYKDEVARIKAETENRGYSKFDMGKISEDLRRTKQSWIHSFDNFIREQVCADFERSPEDVVKRAEQLADLREAVIRKHFPEGEYHSLGEE